MIVHQVLSGAGPVDAVTVQALRIQSLMARWGWKGEVWAGHIDPRIAKRVRSLRDLAPEPDATLLIHYSAYAPRLRRVLDLPQRKVLLSHNVTPARWFWDYEPTIAIHCALGRRQLPEYAAACEVVAGVSHYNAAELGSDVVIPILFDPAHLGAAGDAAVSRPAGNELLFVGRLAPHKRQDELIRLVALLRRHRVPDATLRLVGEPLNPKYLQALRGLAEELAPGAVTFESSLSDAELADRYRRAAAFVCLSEHEGFCIPVLEAMHLGAPVVTRPVGGIPEVAGDAALLVEDRDLAVVAEAVALVLEDASLRSTLVARGLQRPAAFSPDATAAKLRAALETA
ncbi:glycosyltransferase [Conexibacter sp. SYSU D00693]|uniref:glycosyltransferase n=1 Tax=Conexibacter sp. SYSU D00693 TaxID=2812560 RepID=UPI00196B0AF3|nr:glycosyltransferase [Conexibacter sp. SYSU D00693]